LTAFKPFRPIDHSVRLQTAEGRVDVVSVEPLGWRWCLAKLKKRSATTFTLKKYRFNCSLGDLWKFKRAMKF
jgi:hypothetical protein